MAKSGKPTKTAIKNLVDRLRKRGKDRVRDDLWYARILEAEGYAVEHVGILRDAHAESLGLIQGAPEEPEPTSDEQPDPEPENEE